MNPFFRKTRKVLLAAIFIASALGTVPYLRAQATNTYSAANEILIVELQGAVDVFAKGSTNWNPAQTNQVLHPQDRLHGAANSRVALRWSDQSIVSFGASTELEILPPGGPEEQAGLHLIRGVISFFHRDQPGRIRIITRGAAAGVEGTEFVLAVNDTDTTTLSVIDGKVRLGNEQATLLLTNGEQAVAAPGTAPARTTGFIANNLLQWCFYYPAVVDPDELQLTSDEQKDLSDSLAAYRSGDLQAALAKYPAGRSNVSDRENVYHAALLLSVGEVDSAQKTLANVSDRSGASKKLGDALLQLIAAVKRQPSVTTTKAELASEMMADSYFEQSRAVRETSLRNALTLARQATAKSPQFGFAWERVAELEFSFGQTGDALKDLDHSLALAPRNAQALALKGFILSAQEKPKAAREWFGRAIAADAALGNAWLGRGLARIRLGDKSGGREDLLVAAALEPQRAELRSYLGKAYIASGDDKHATKELALAKKLDPQDPTAWLYSALQNQQNNQVNDAIRDLEKSQQLNDNRSVYRSQLLLDQDRAVRSANLAGMYQDAGMFDWSVREAGRAVSYDYANYSAHIFLASSYDQMRDPALSSLRFETSANSEFWTANLLAPTSAGWISDETIEQPYNKLFDQNRVGVASETTYLDRGAWVEKGSQFGTYDNFSYSLEAEYRADPGQRVNNDIEHRNLSLALKYQFTPQDSAFASVQQFQENFGDLREYYNRNSAVPTLRVDETQEPNIYLGYHHEWSPGVHTLFFGSYLHNDESTFANNVAQLFAINEGGQITETAPINLDQLRYKIFGGIYSAEAQQIWEGPVHTTVVGTRYQWGHFNYDNSEVSYDLLSFDFNTAPNILDESFKTGFHRLSFYGYHNWQILDSLMLVGGLAYDDLYAPENVGAAPASPGERNKVQFSPKIGFIWTPARNTIVRGAYTRSLSGALNDQSMRIEPTEVAGFNQAFRSIAPESAVGGTSAADFQTYDLSLEQKFNTGTYFSLTGELLSSVNDQRDGAFIFYVDQTITNDLPTFPDGLRKSLNYREQSLLFTADQLIGKEWSVGMKYRLTQSLLDTAYINQPVAPQQHSKSILNEVDLHANWNHPSGLFSSFEANWYHQNNSGFSSAEPGDDFWQFNTYAGYRFWHRRAELAVGLLNIADQNYHLEPLNPYNELPHGRTFLARVRINF